MQTYRDSNYNLKEQKAVAADPKVKQKAVASADYISDMILELRNMAKANGQKTLQGLLEMAYYEAFSLANPVELTNEEREKLRELESYAKSALTTNN